MVKLNEKYNLLGSDSRYFIITGGRGSGKSYAETTFLLFLTYESNQVILFTRYTLVSANVSIIPEFISKIEELNAHADFHITKDEIINLTTGSKILFKGIKTSSGNQTANLKSLADVSCWVLDEAEELTDEEIFDKIDLSIRVNGTQNRVMLVMNPVTKEHFIYKKFFEGKGVEGGSNMIKGDTTYIHTNYLDNIKNLSESYLNRILEIKEKNPAKYNHAILGSWLNKAEGVVFENWKFGEFNPDKHQTLFGQDFGFSVDPTTLIEIAIDKKKKKLYVKEHLYKTRLNTSDIAAHNIAAAGRKLIVADSAEGRLIDELRKMRCNIIECKKGDGSINAGIEIMKDYEIIVDPDSTNIAKELNNYAYANKGSKLYIDAFNHCIDAIRYAVSFATNGSRGVSVR